MFYTAGVCFFLFVCQSLSRITLKFLTNFDEIFGGAASFDRQELITFWWRSGSRYFRVALTAYCVDLN